MRRSRILGVGSYVPSQVVTNADLEKIMETTDEWIVKRTGIRQRHWVVPGQQCTSDLGLKAAERALESSGVAKEEIQMIILGTLSPDHEFPGTACFLQAKMGLSGIATLDIRQQCTGFIYGMSIADQFIRTGTYDKILVVGAEVHSVGLDISTRGRDVAVLFGDGGGAVVMSACDVNDAKTEPHLYSTHLHADGKNARELWIPAPGSDMGSRIRITQEMMDEGLHFPHMNGKKVFIHAVKKMSQTLTNCLQQNQKTVADVDLFLFHQANLRINEAVADEMRIPREKVFNTIDRFGNTTAATLPLGMDEAIKAGKLKKGMLVALAAFGSGFTWASALYRY